ncbi:glutathione S-transferase T1-like protein [Cinnamomum micranthum f. kanehirae]|uniref:Glutathione S-transferase T1-like protein n=1 Tax=Cinnamomum micranthum f. kanehirae TaxID=337451 RepID=A0A443N0Z0_9MAGN|nr:glutathione S-transferase T1-like protein [Cinnamomum micranthum f. kanehirae]
MGLKIYVDHMSQPSRAIIIFCKYPADLFKRAKIQSVLDWHHSNLRRGAASYVLNTMLGPALGRPLNPQAAAEAEILLSSSLSKIESFWLKGNAKFLLGSLQPSIADLSLVCEIMQLEVLDEKDRDRILGPHKKILQWIENLKYVTKPHFDEAHEILYKAKARIHKKLLEVGNRMGGSRGGGRRGSGRPGLGAPGLGALAWAPSQGAATTEERAPWHGRPELGRPARGAAAATEERAPGMGAPDLGRPAGEQQRRRSGRPGMGAP